MSLEEMMIKIDLKMIFGLFFLSFSLYANEDPCHGSNMLLSLINRPSFSNSPCTVPTKNLLLEGGFQNHKLVDERTQNNGPSLNIRLGISNNSELDVLPSNYIHQTTFPFSGSTPTWIGIKHRFYYNAKWVISGEGFFSPPSGNLYFGSPNPEAAINAILYNEITNNLTWQFQIGISSLSDAKFEGGHQFQSINPNFLMNYNYNKISMYFEFFGQTKTKSYESFGLNGGLGLIWLFNSKTTFDIEFYQRVIGKLDGFERLFGAGITYLIEN